MQRYCQEEKSYKHPLLPLAMEEQTPADPPLQVLREIFNYQEFRPNQRAIIESILQGKSALAILPTGAGKSLCFQIPALILSGLTLVISPLIALMKDQVDNLRKKGIMNAAFLNSSLAEGEQEEIYSRIKEQEIKILYLAPETLLNNKLLNVLQEAKISFIAIDEAHCISTWGHDFRPDYLKLKGIIHELKNPPLLALTATANKKVEQDIINQLNIHLEVFKDTFDRKNLLLSVLKLKPGQQKNSMVREILEKIPGSGIIYVNFIKTSEDLSVYLRGQGISCDCYNGSLEHSRRRQIQESFIQGKTRIIVATNAFGMGIDKPDIRLIIHYDPPKSLESYYQETGRAGRDSKDSHCVLLYSQEDSIKLKKFIRLSLPEPAKIEKLKKFLEKDAGKTIYARQKRLAEDLEIDEVTFRLLLHHLEKLNLIKVYNKIFRRALIKDIKFLEMTGEAKNLFSSYYFEKNKQNWIDLEELSQLTEMPLQKINALLYDLRSRDQIKLFENDAATPIEIKTAIKTVEIKEIEDLFRKLMMNNISKLKEMLEYIDCSECKKKFILNYFGESSNLSCRICNYCNPGIIGLSHEKRSIQLTEKDHHLLEQQGDGEMGIRTKATFTVLEAVQQLDAKEIRIGKNTLTEFLKGSKSKKIMEKNVHGLKAYSSLRAFSGKEILSIISYLIQEGYLTIIDADSEYPRPLLYLTEHGEALLEEKEKINLGS